MKDKGPGPNIFAHEPFFLKAQGKGSLYLPPNKQDRYIHQAEDPGKASTKTSYEHTFPLLKRHTVLSKEIWGASIY